MLIERRIIYPVACGADNFFLISKLRVIDSSELYWRIAGETTASACGLALSNNNQCK